MMLLAIGGALLLALALIVREWQLGRERLQREREIGQLRQTIERHRSHLRRTVEDLYVLRRVLSERRVVDDHDLTRGRARLIEAPRRQAEERDEMLRDLELQANQLIIEEPEPKVH